MDTQSLSLVQYVFTKGDHEVKPGPHRNAKHSEGYERTAKKALAFVSETEGGIECARSAGALPRNRQQVNDIRRMLAGPTDPDPIFSLMLMCKESQGHKGSNPFVRLVNVHHFL